MDEGKGSDFRVSLKTHRSHGGKNRVDIVITPQAKSDILNTIAYLKENWDQKVVDDFLQKLELFYRFLSINPKIFVL